MAVSATEANTRTNTEATAVTRAEATAVTRAEATHAEATNAEAMCPYRLVMEHVTSRWGVLILIELMDRPYRFSELRRAVSGYGRGVSEKMLTQTLQTLERDGLIHRDAHPVIPPRVDYSLTDLGREAAEQVRGLAAWTERRMGDVEKARQVYDETKTRA